jgi:hypothetical protein
LKLLKRSAISPTCNTASQPLAHAVVVSCLIVEHSNEDQRNRLEAIRGKERYELCLVTNTDAGYKRQRMLHGFDSINLRLVSSTKSFFFNNSANLTAVYTCCCRTGAIPGCRLNLQPCEVAGRYLLFAEQNDSAIPLLLTALIYFNNLLHSFVNNQQSYSCIMFLIYFTQAFMAFRFNKSVCEVAVDAIQ